jgi:hypothetical protein
MKVSGAFPQQRAQLISMGIAILPRNAVSPTFICAIYPYPSISWNSVVRIESAWLKGKVS